MNNLTPNLFVIGAPKSGTTALVAQLGAHPEIFVPKIKEPRYFDARVFYDKVEDYPLKSYVEYLDLYKSEHSLNSKYRVDGSVFIMYSKEIIDEILIVSPHAKFILMLRDPLEAAKSMHLQRLKYADAGLREVSESFCDCWKLMGERSKGNKYPENCRNKFLFRYDLLYQYEKYLCYLLETIPKYNLLIIEYNLFRTKPSYVQQSVQIFLGINQCRLPNVIINESYKVSASKFRQLIARLLRATKQWRNKIGLIKGKYPVLDILLGGRKLPVKICATDCDHAVSLFFENTKVAMNTAFDSHGCSNYLDQLNHIEIT